MQDSAHDRLSSVPCRVDRVSLSPSRRLVAEKAWFEEGTSARGSGRRVFPRPSQRRSLRPDAPVRSRRDRRRWADPSRRRVRRCNGRLRSADPIPRHRLSAMIPPCGARRFAGGHSFFRPFCVRQDSANAATAAGASQSALTTRRCSRWLSARALRIRYSGTSKRAAACVGVRRASWTYSPRIGCGSLTTG